VLGYTKVGKTSIFKSITEYDKDRLLCGTYKQTLVLDMHSVLINNTILHVWDTMGIDDISDNPEITDATDYLVNMCTLFVIVFALDNIDSWNFAQTMIKRISKLRTSPFLIILVGNDMGLGRVVGCEDIDVLKQSNTGTEYFEVKDSCYDIIIHLEETLR
jgi:GTPase SAR1 family protein